MKILRVLIVAIIAGGFFLSIAQAKPEYTKNEHKTCTFCHVKMSSKELNDAGKYYKDHNHSLDGYKAPDKK